MPFACIFVPDFPVEAVLRAEPELRAQPVAVLAGKPPLQKVLGVNEKARQLGIEPGMAKIQVEPCTELTLRVRSPLQEAAAHAALLDCAQSFSPRVEDTAPNTVLLDLAGLESLFGPSARIARDLARRASGLGLEAHVAVAANPDTAMFAARGFSGVTLIPEGKEAERLGDLPLDVLFPELTQAAPEDESPKTPSPKTPSLKPQSQQAESLKTSTLKKSSNQAALLKANSSKTDPSEATRFLETFDLWGVRNLRALAALPDVALSQRLGQAGLHLQQLARGATMRTLVPVDLPLVFEEAIDLDHPLVLLEPLAFLLAHMLDQLCARLAARALAAQELRLQFELDHGFHFVEDIPEPEPADEDESIFAAQMPAPTTGHVGTGAPVSLPRTESRGPADPQGRHSDGTSNSGKPRPHFTRTLRLPVPMLDPKTFLKLLQLDLNAHPPGAPILKIHLSAEPARPRSAQSGLFQPPTPEPEKLELTLARIAGLVGSGNVGGAELLDTHHPAGFRMQRFIPTTPAPRSKNAKPRNPKNKNQKNQIEDENSAAPPDRTADAPITALRIFRPPLQATVTLRDGQPVHIVCMRRKEIAGDILWMAGPWRSSGDWWEQDGWSRDEWDIAIELPVAKNQLSVGKGHLLFSSGQASEKSGLALYRLVHDLLSGHWFVEGTYD